MMNSVDNHDPCLQYTMNSEWILDHTLYTFDFYIDWFNRDALLRYLSDGGCGI